MEFEVSAIQRQWRERARQALAKAAQELLDAAAADAPYDPAPSGRHLRDSGRVEFRETPGATIAEVVFAGPYAARQHEHVEYRHPHGGKAKFLESNLVHTRVLDRLAEAERELMR